jgi:hypothetical protein
VDASAHDILDSRESAFGYQRFCDARDVAIP